MWLRLANKTDIDKMVDAAAAGTYKPSQFPPVDEDFSSKLSRLSRRKGTYVPADLRAEGYALVQDIEDAGRRFAENYDRQHAAA